MYVFFSSTADNGNQNGDGFGSDIVICTLVINIIMVMFVLLYICIGGTLHDKCPCKRLKEQQVRRFSTTNNDEIMIISVVESPNDQHMTILYTCSLYIQCKHKLIIV